ncbi:leucine--tRNA ligase [Sodalis-like secondary symbiont of Drepanosiphum platanoidis]|uniref:leucine--tRNA ligase n=1 Tax=Sodalis-like secondary symbiont of Drepanosiphum platanoidis TaxID=2994493 RepID=UPI00346437C5
MKEFYFPKKIEIKAQKYWEKNKTFKVFENSQKKKYYCLSMFPYPSGKLHIGHLRNYTIGDVISRYHRMLGYNVLQPIGWDAFGLPAETEALKNNITPKDWTKKNILYMKKQLKTLGFSYDWSREITTCVPEYYKWEQKFFINLYKKGLVYKKMSLVNWCEYDKTVLANEQVINNCCWRCGNLITKKNISQWFIKITNYANQLLKDLNILNKWPSKVKNMQKKWIGKSKGIKIIFKIKNLNKNIKIYTTYPDMFMGITYIAISMYHPFSIKESKKNINIFSFIKKQTFNINTKKYFKEKKKLGIFSGLYAIHPINKKKLPIWIVNFIDLDYGTGAIMGVPAYNKNDFEFAKKYNIPLIKIFCFKKNNKEILYNSGEFNGLSRKEASKAIIKKLINLKIAKYLTCYKLRDWGVSRQRYWGTPIPMITLEDGTIIPIKENELPINLPKLKSLNKNSLKSLKDYPEWFNINFNGKKAFRETDTFDTFIESSWYLHRYTSPNFEGIINPVSANYWLPVDQYIGGIEHATMHLLYLRFYHKLLRDEGLLITDEPVKSLICQGMVLADTFYYINNKNEKIWVSPDNIFITRDKNGKIIKAIDNKNNDLIYCGMKKMSKSKKNGIDPQKMIEKYGADTMRLFIMFSAPIEMNLEWKESGIKGSYRFINKLWKLIYQHINNKYINIKNKILDKNYKNIKYMLNKTILKVTNDINKKNNFNTAISSIMEFINFLSKLNKNSKKINLVMQESFSVIVRMLYPFIPHVCFYLWKCLGYNSNIDYVKWPKIKYKYLIKEEILIVIQVNGKVREKIMVPINFNKDKIKKFSLKMKSVNKYILNTSIKKIIYVPKKLINFVTN